MFLAPFLHDGQSRAEFFALGGQDIVKAFGRRAIGAALQDADLNEALQTVCEQMPGHAAGGCKLFEFGLAEIAIAQDQQGPAVSDDGERPRDRAPVIVEF